MNEKIRSLKRKQEEVFREMKTLREKADTEKRSFTPEEDEKWDRLDARFNELEAEVAKEIKLEERAKELENTLHANDDLDAQRANPAGAGKKPLEVRATPEYTKHFADFLKSGERNFLNSQEYRGLVMDADIYGGFLVASEQFVQKLIQAVDDMVWMRGLATIIPCKNAHSLGVPTFETDASAASWTTEVAEPTADSTMAFGKRDLFPHPLVKLIKCSEKLLRSSALDVEGLINQRLAVKLAAAQESAFMSGTGSNQPLGVFTASNDGVPTTRDFGATTNAATYITAEGLIDSLYGLKPQYLKNAVWLFHRDAIKQVRKLKDATSGQFIWQPGLSADKQPSILDKPYIMSEYVPNTFTASLYVGMIADFSFYWIADALDMRIQRLAELYATSNQVGFIGRVEVDGAPVLAEAFARVKLAAS